MPFLFREAASAIFGFPFVPLFPQLSLGVILFDEIGGDQLRIASLPNSQDDQKLLPKPHKNAAISIPFILPDIDLRIVGIL
jgi:hypothetical protein